MVHWAAGEPVEELSDHGRVSGVHDRRRWHLFNTQAAAALVLVDADHLVPVHDHGAALALDAVILVVPAVLPAAGQARALVLGKGAVGHLHRVQREALAVEARRAGVPLPTGNRRTVGAAQVPNLVKVVDAALDQDGVAHLVAEGGAPGVAAAIVGGKARDNIVGPAQPAGLEDSA